MRFPNETLPAAVPPVDPTEVSPKAAINAIRRIGDGNRGTSPQFGGGAFAQGSGGQMAEVERQVFYTRAENDRRKMCRRIHDIPVLLDTRSGEERRKEPRRPDDPLLHMDREA